MAERIRPRCGGKLSLAARGQECSTLSDSGQDGSGYYIPKLKRRLLPDEAAALQGVPTQVFLAMTAAARDNNIPLSALLGSLGDAMSVNVLATVLMRGLNHAGLAKFGPSQDYWRLIENGSSAAHLSDNLLFHGTPWPVR